MICNKPCNNKNEFNYCKTTTCIHPEMWSFIILPEKCLENSKLDALNKGIDDLIKKYEDMVKLFDGDSYIQTIPIEMLEDLEKLKGE